MRKYFLNVFFLLTFSDALSWWKCAAKKEKVMLTVGCQVSIYLCNLKWKDWCACRTLGNGRIKKVFDRWMEKNHTFILARHLNVRRLSSCFINMMLSLSFSILKLPSVLVFAKYMPSLVSSLATPWLTPWHDWRICDDQRRSCEKIVFGWLNRYGRTKMMKFKRIRGRKEMAEILRMEMENQRNDTISKDSLFYLKKIKNWYMNIK